MIGYRGASRYIREPDIFRLEVDAIKAVRKEFKNLYVMVPFVRTPKELQGVKQLLAEQGLVRGDALRIGFGLYHEEADVDAFARLARLLS